jgi:hypothetical protein
VTPSISTPAGSSDRAPEPMTFFARTCPEYVPADNPLNNAEVAATSVTCKV